MVRPRDWLTVHVPEALSSWLWWAFRRPRWSLPLLVVIPLLIVVIATQRINVRLAKTQALQHLSVTARLAAQIIEV
jgi:hypothetical protein